MLEKVHDHITSELQQNTRTDTIFVVTAIVFNLIVLAINSAVAGEAGSSSPGAGSDIILAVFITMSILVNTISVSALRFGRRNREQLIRGLLSMYKDNKVAKYYDKTLISGYRKRYLLFTGVILCLAATGMVVPLIVRFVG
jgi:hypothetical protein